jgi:hypothetical protein
MNGALGAIARTLFEALSPLQDALQSPAAFEQLLRDLGHEGVVTAEGLTALDAAVTFADLVPRGEELVAQLDAPDGADVVSVVTELVDLGQDLLAAIESLSSVNGALIDPSLADPALWQDLADALPGHLLVAYLEDQVPLAYGLMRWFGVIHDLDLGGGETRELFDLDQLGQVVGDPVGALRALYGWGSGPTFLYHNLVDELALLLAGLGRIVETGPVRERFVERFFGPAPNAAEGVQELTLPLLRGQVDDAFVDTGLSLLPVPASPGLDVSQLFLTNVAWGTASADVEPIEGWTLEVSADLDATGAIGVRLAPDGVTVEDAPPEGVVTWSLNGTPPEKWTLLGGLVEIGGVDLGLDVSGSGPSTELTLSAQIRDGAVVIEPGEGDSFLKYLIGSNPMRLSLSPELAWSSKDGLKLGGSLGLDVTIPITLNLGPVFIEDLHLAFTGEAGITRVQADVRTTAELGPLVATISGMGVALEAARPTSGNGGSLGSLDANVVFVPPRGIGFAIVSDVASGGGYVEADPDAGRYAGVLDVEILDVGLTATGILATQMPDGSEGWSLFFSLAATFTALPLGFGFTLNGVGGLIGIHRGLDADALGDGVRTGALDSILFPEDPIADADTILADIGAIFPVQPDQFVFGPIAKIGWGSPTVMELDLGVVVELPDPISFTLLGSLSAVLPDEEAALLVLNVDVAGVFDLTAGTIAVDASLRDSQVVGLSLSGDMAVRASFLDEPSFLLSFGGFNPHFAAPGNFPDLNRLSVSLDTGDALRIVLWGYFAVSSNTVQFGAGADLWASAAGLTVEGHFSFDALLQFNPFLFIIDLGFGVEVRAGRVELFGVHLDLMLEGPNPFHVVGTAEMKILGVKTSFALDETIGRREVEGPPEVVFAMALLVDALGEPGAWREVPPDADASMVTLAEGEGDEALRVHPAGALEVVQRVVPLKRDLDHFGAAELGDLERFELLHPTLGGKETSGVSDVEDWFAPVQFYEIGEEEKISAPSFERMASGLRLEGEGVAAAPASPFPLTYEQIIRDPDLDLVDRRPDGLYAPTSRDLSIVVRTSAVARARRATSLSTSRSVASPYALRPTAWVATDTTTGAIDDAVTPSTSGERLGWFEARSAVEGAGKGAVVAPRYETEMSV